MGSKKPISLRVYLRHEQPGLTTILDIISALVEQIGRLNAQNIVYNDINPSNIQIDIQNKAVSLSPSKLSFDISAPKYDPKIDQAIQGDFVYISPECTGRTAHGVDFRSDYYSLGIIFYQLMVGSPPFDFTDPLQTMHAHVAMVPVPVAEINGQIPLPLSRMISKLLEKNPSERYQSTAGLLVDLANCRDQLNSKGRIDDFPIGKKDVSPVFEIPDKLYGRYREIKDLLNKFTVVKNGGSGIVFFSGPPGIGKSALVNEVQRHLVGGGNNGHFISGKFDQYENTLPCKAVIQAISGIVRWMLTLTNEALKPKCETILKAVGQNGALIIDVIPELVLIIGEQPAPAKLAPMEARNRFNYVFDKFIKAVVTFTQPLIVFLDDLQWAESASINIIQTIFMDSGLEHVLFIGAYRDIEAANNPLLNAMLRDVRQTKPEAQFIPLEPLDEESVGMMIQDMFAIDEPEASQFINLLATRTACNPLFIKKFLTFLHEEGLLQYMPARHAQQNCASWHVDIKGVFAAQLPESISTLLTQLLGKLPPATQECLKIAACIGSRFTMALLVAVCEKQMDTIEGLLQQTIDQGMLVKVDDGFRFIHDRIRETAYQMIDSEKRAEIHYAIGKVLLSGVASIAAEPVFDMASQLNSAIELLDREERTDLIQLNFSAGQKAKCLTAYPEALNYFKTCMELMGEQAWQRQYDLALAVHTEATETAYLCSDFEYSEKLTQRVIQHAHTTMDQFGVREIRMRCLFSQHRLAEAVKVGFEMQELLGYKFPKKPGKLRVLWELLSIWPQLRKATPAKLQRFQETKDPKVLAHRRVLVVIGIQGILLIPNLIEVTLLRILRTTFSKGLTPESSSAFAYLGAVLCKLGFTDTGYRLGQIALSLIQRPNVEAQEKGKTLMAVHYTMCWKGHIRETLQPLREAYTLCLESGDPEIAANVAMAYCSFLIDAGTPLADVLAEVNQYIKIMQKNRQQQVLLNLQLIHQSILTLMGLCPSQNTSFENIGGNDNDAITSEDRILRCRKHIVYMLMNYVKSNYAEAVEHSSCAIKFISHSVFLFQPVVYYSDSLMRLGLINSYTASEKVPRSVWKRIGAWFANKYQLRKIAANQKRLKKAARYSPINFMNKWVLIEAECRRIRGKNHQAERYYKQAIDLSKEHLFLQEEALANELLAKFYLASAEKKRAQKHLEQALKLYEEWGASAMKHRLLEEFQSLLMPPDPQIESGSPIAYDVEDHLKASPVNLAEVGLQLFSESLNSFSNKADVKIYLMQLSQNIMHYTGAQRVLLLFNSNPLSIGVDHQIGKSPQALIPMQKDTAFPEMIIQYVVRTQANLLIDDASQSDMFASDAYVQKHQVKSVICIPLIFQNRLSTILYLENNVSIGVFTPRLQKLLKGLSNQIALLLEHEALKTMQSQSPATSIGVKELKAILQADYGLTIQEAKIALLFKDGYTRPQITEMLNISTQTLRKHMQMIYDKTVNPEDNFTSEGRVDKLSRLILFLFRIEGRGSTHTNPNLNTADSGLYVNPKNCRSATRIPDPGARF